VWAIGGLSGIARWLEFVAIAIFAYELTRSPELVALLAVLRMVLRAARVPDGCAGGRGRPQAPLAGQFAGRDIGCHVAAPIMGAATMQRPPW
jgi:hypothetical protein